MDPAFNAVYIAAMILITILVLGGYIAWAVNRDNARSRDGSYGLQSAKNKSKADIVGRQTQLDLIKIGSPKKEEFEPVAVTRE